MKLIDRVKNKIFKSNLTASVEYHAGGFFVRKQVLYLIFTAQNTAFLYQREEGLHPNDNNYKLLYNQIIDDNKIAIYNVAEPKTNDDLLYLLNNGKELRCMPSIFIENINTEYLTEIILDKWEEKAHVFNLVFTIDI